MNQHHHNKNEYDECALRGICSTNPILSFVQSVVRQYMQELAFYLIELGDLGVENKKIKKDFIDAFAGLISDVEYSQDDLNNVISTLYEDANSAKEIYKELCQRNGIQPKYRKSTIKMSKQLHINDAIKQGQKYFYRKT